MLPTRHRSASYFLSLIFGLCLMRWRQYSCRVDAASLFSCAGQFSVTPEYNLKNATIFSSAPNVHLASEKKWRKKRHLASSDQHSSRAQSPGEKIQYCCGRSSHLSQNGRLYLNPCCEPPRRKERKKARGFGRNETPSAAHSSKKH